jgi:hypothetical protein
MLTTQLHLVLRLRMSRAIPLFPLYTFMVWTWSSVDEICHLLGYYAVNSGNSLKAFADNLSAQSSKVMNLWILDSRRGQILSTSRRKLEVTPEQL